MASDVCMFDAFA
ncbi:hypothetical protein WKN18_003682 [Vibrio cholerae]|nr:hypothetical protein [Vibrio cholerae]MDA5312492.1 hypothetical protein [Vibrio cholerae]MDA5312504.1 hypothetical protein [Vibrio cholerae]NAO21215.1 hypothetical protein [Vibrio cholerae]TXX58168.1 hypothetical protein FXF06_09435 [Vibrio cholerae]